MEYATGKIIDDDRNHNARLRKGLILANNVESDDFEVKLRLIILRKNCIKPSVPFTGTFILETAMRH